MASHDPATCPCNKCVARRHDSRTQEAVEAAVRQAQGDQPPIHGAGSTPRTDVYRAIDSERDYQEVRWAPDACPGRTPEDHHHSVLEWLAFIQSYVREGMEICSRQADPAASQNALHIVRKVAAMGVTCMEQNGAPQREGYER